MVSDSPALRRLGPMELYSSSRHSLGIYRAVTVSARYVPVFSPTAHPSPRFLAALAVVVRAQPMLRVGITDEHTNSARFTHLTHMDLRKHVYVVTVDADSEQALSMEVTRVQAAQHDVLWEDTPSKAPWRVTIVRSETQDCEDVIFAFHHALLDGTSGVRFHEALIMALDSATTPDDDSLLTFPTPPALPAPQEEAVAFTLSPIYIATMLWNEFAPAMLKPAPQHVWGGQRISVARPYITRLRVVDVPAEQTRAVLAACRANGTTLTGLLHALVLAYFTKSLPENAVPGFRAATPMSLHRRTHDTSLPTTLRVLLCSTEHDFSPTDISSMRAALTSPAALTNNIWAAADRIRADLVACGQALTHNNAAAVMRYVSDWRRFHLARDGTPRTNSWECSNVGVLEGKVSRVVFANGAMVTGAAVGVNVASVRGGRLSVTVSWQEGIVEDELAEGLGEALEGMIERFCARDVWSFK